MAEGGAPSAPGAATATPGQPAAPEATKPQGQTEKGDTGAGEKRAIRPIRTGNLPGVESRNTRVDDNGDPVDKKVGRGPDGRFTAQDVADALDDDSGFVGEDEPDAHDAPPGEAPEPRKAASRPPVPGKPEEKPQPQKFKFADQEFATQEEAEQNFRSLRGMHKPLQDKLKAYERELQESDAVARAWADKFRDLATGKLGKAERAAFLQQLGVKDGPEVAGNAANAGGSGGEASDVDEILSGIDMDALEFLAADPEAGFKVAMRYFASELLGAVQNKLVPKIESRMQSSIQPFVQDRAMHERVARVDKLIESVGEYKNPVNPSEYAFPELRDPQLITEVGEAWFAAGGSPDALETPAGLIDAVARYRLVKSLQPSAGGPAVVAGAPVVVPRPAPAPGVAASLGSETRGGGAQPNRPRRSPQHQAIIEALDKAGEIDPDLGFQRNRRLSADL